MLRVFNCDTVAFSWSIFTKIVRDVSTPQRNNEFVRGRSISHHPLPYFTPQNPYFRPKGPETHENIK